MFRLGCACGVLVAIVVVLAADVSGVHPDKDNEDKLSVGRCAAFRTIHIRGEEKSGTTFLEVLVSEALREMCAHHNGCVVRTVQRHIYVVDTMSDRHCMRLKVIVRDKHSLVWTRKRLPTFLRHCGRMTTNNTECFDETVLDRMRRPEKQEIHVLIVRDPRDCLVSGAHFFAPRTRIDDYVSKNAAAVTRRVAYRHQLVSIMPPQNAFIMYYEEWMSRPYDITRNMLSFFGIFVDRTVVKRIADAVSFDTMRKRENQHLLPGPNRPGAPDRKVRPGTVGGYRRELKADTVERVTNIMKHVFPDVLLNRYVSI